MGEIIFLLNPTTGRLVTKNLSFSWIQLVIGRFFGDDNIMWMAFDQPSIGNAYKPGFFSQVFHVFRANIAHT